MAVRNSIALVIALSSSLYAAHSAAYEAGDILIRAGLTTVQPNDSSSALTSDGTSLAGSFADVDDNTQLGITVSYMFDSQWGVEVLAATSFTHDIYATVPGLLPRTRVAEVTQLPPTVSAIYYFPSSTNIHPYVGLGLNYTTFFNEDATSDFEAAAGTTDVDLTESWGLAAQLGVDYQLDENWSLNASVRYIEINTEANLRTSNLGVIETEVDIDPTVYTLSVGYRF